MPTKQFLMDNYDSATDILNYASENHGVYPTLIFLKKQQDATVHVRACLASNHATMFDGGGDTTKEALADCIANQFPG